MPRERTAAQIKAEQRYYKKMAYVTLKLTPAQHMRFRACAMEANMTVAGFIRYCALRYVDYVESEFFQPDDG